MKATIQTRIFLALTVDEARAATLNATDAQLEIRSALYQIDGMPVSEMMGPKPALLAAPKNGHKRTKAKRADKLATKSTNRIKAQNKECPHCHEMKSPIGYYRHVIACKAKHQAAPAPESLPDEEYPDLP
jgi:hypothetical protein